MISALKKNNVLYCLELDEIEEKEAKENDALHKELEELLHKNSPKFKQEQRLTVLMAINRNRQMPSNFKKLISSAIYESKIFDIIFSMLDSSYKYTNKYAKKLCSPIPMLTGFEMVVSDKNRKRKIQDEQPKRPAPSKRTYGNH